MIARVKNDDLSALYQSFYGSAILGCMLTPKNGSDIPDIAKRTKVQFPEFPDMADTLYTKRIYRMN